MRILVISLEQSTERREWIESNFGQNQLDFEFVPGVDAKNLGIEDVERFNSASSGPPMMPGEIAVFKSHQKCWAAAAAGNDDYVCIFEDDVHLSSNARHFLHGDEWIPPGADIIKIETFRNNVLCSNVSLPRVREHEFLRLHTLHWGAAGYIVSKECAARLTEISRHKLVASDEFLFSPELGVLRELEVYQICPALCIQDTRLNESLTSGRLPSIKGIRDEYHLSLQPQAPVHGFRKVKRELIRPIKRLFATVDHFFNGKYVTIIPFDRKSTES